MFIPSDGTYIPDDQRFAGAEFNPHKLHRILFTLLQKEGEAVGLDTEGNSYTVKTSFFVKNHQKNFWDIKNTIELTNKLKAFIPELSNEGTSDTAAKDLPKTIRALSDKLYDLRKKFRQEIDVHYCSLLRFNPAETLKENTSFEALPGLEDDSAIELKTLSSPRSI